MSAPGTGYDEVGSRTRQAWLRTSLGAAAVTLLALRGLVLAGADPWVLVAGLAPAVVVVTVAILRSMRLQHGESEPMATSTAIGLSAAIVALAVLAGAGALAGLVAR